MRQAGRFTDRRALALTLCWFVGLVIAGSTDVFLFLAPALLIVIPLFAGVYIGEELIAELAGRRRRGRRRRRVAAQSMPRALLTWRPVGTSLMALSLAKRPPPAAPLLQN
jgi:hypothetical protein